RLRRYRPCDGQHRDRRAAVDHRADRRRTGAGGGPRRTGSALCRQADHRRDQPPARKLRRRPGKHRRSDPPHRRARGRGADLPRPSQPQRAQGDGRGAGRPCQ
ncbi:hypothetical protein LTR94_035869, partial [Friedmanniomyces endolithicus]